MERIVIYGRTPEGCLVDVEVEVSEGSITINGHCRFIWSEEGEWWI